MHIFKIPQSPEYHQLILTANNHEINPKNLAFYLTRKEKKSIVTSLEKFSPNSTHLSCCEVKNEKQI